MKERVPSAEPRKAPKPKARPAQRPAQRPAPRKAAKPKERDVKERGPSAEPRKAAKLKERPEQRPAQRPEPRKAPKPKERPAPRAPEPAPEGPQKSGAIALIGRANVGKSTLLNAALGQDLAIVSPTPQTTRDNLLGVLHRGNVELRLLDTPGLHRPKSELGRVMNHFAREAARAADVIVFVTDVPQPRKKAGPPAPHPGDVTLLQSFKDGAEGAEGAPRPIVLVVNKVDVARDKSALLPLIDGLSKILPFEAIVPLSARRAPDVERLLDVIAGLCPEGPWQFGPDDLTDRPSRYFAAEYVREQILRATRLEVPHAAAVTIDRFSEPETGPVEIDVTIHVERPGQKKILIGTGGETLKRIGTAARLKLKEMLGRSVILKTWVRVTPAWRASAEKLADMGYEKKQGGEQTQIFAELAEEDDEEQEQ